MHACTHMYIHYTSHKHIYINICIIKHYIYIYIYIYIYKTHSKNIYIHTQTIYTCI